MERVVIRLGQVERMIMVVVMRPVMRVMVMIVIGDVIMIVVVVVLVVMMMEVESEEGMRVLVVAGGMRVRDDARAGDGRRGEEGRLLGCAPYPMPCGMPLALSIHFPAPAQGHAARRS
jgi:hypothetical protein